MNWKILLVIASLTVSAGLTSCSKADTTKTETTTETKPVGGDAMKSGEPAKTTTTTEKTTEKK